MTSLGSDQLFTPATEFDWGPARRSPLGQLGRAMALVTFTIAVATAAAAILWSYRMG